MMIPIAGPWVTEKEIEYVRQAVTDGFYGNAGKWQTRFEQAFAQHTGRRYAVATNSCTAALHLALKAMGIGPGDEVIVPDITWIATAAPVIYVGATPIFADIEATTWCLDPASVELHITPKTKAIIAVDLYGGMPDWSALLEVANRHGLWLIEDAAQAPGSSLYGRPAGSFGDVSVFSFHGTKTLTTGGEGGMLVTDDAQIVKQAHYYQNHCKDDKSKMFWNTDVGFKYKMTDMQAAMGCAQLERLAELVAKKTQIWYWYNQHLPDYHGALRLNAPSDPKLKFINSYWMTTVAWHHFKTRKPKEQVMVDMQAHDVACRPFFYPLSGLPAFADLLQAKLIRYRHTFRIDQRTSSVAYALSPYAINLPSALSLVEADVIEVCKALKESL